MCATHMCIEPLKVSPMRNAVDCGVTCRLILLDARNDYHASYKIEHNTRHGRKHRERRSFIAAMLLFLLDPFYTVAVVVAFMFIFCFFLAEPSVELATSRDCKIECTI